MGVDEAKTSSKVVAAQAADEPPVPPISASAFPTLEVVRLILEFVAKAFYPAIIIALLYLIWPKISSIDFNSLLGNLQSAKVGEVELTFAQAQDIGAEIAPLNSKIAELERKLNVAQTNLLQLQKVAKLPKQSSREIQALVAKEQALQANASYTVLVFHRADSKDRAASLTQSLLADGYQSSDTETNFSELKSLKPEDNVIYLTYTSEGKKLLPALQDRIAALEPKAEVQVSPQASDLKRGDVQILVF